MYAKNAAEKPMPATNFANQINYNINYIIKIGVFQHPIYLQT